MQQTWLSRIIGIVVLLSILFPSGARPVALAEPGTTVDDEIIYIDSGNFIRVIDPNVAQGTQQIQWSSPDNGWFDFATGDFNNDGDKEIVAIGNNKLTVFDPVVRGNAITPDGEFNLVPWVRLHERSLVGADIIGAGDLDKNVPGDEIVVGYNVDEANNTKYRVEVLKTSDGGRTWTTHISQGFGAKWTYIKVGNIDNQGSDDLLMGRTTPGDSLVVAQQVDNNFALIFDRPDSTIFTQRDGAIGQIYAGGTGEVVLLRTYNGTVEAPTLLLYQFVNGHWPPIEDPNKEIESETNFPHPFDIVVGDVNGNGDDEIIWLREVPTDNTTIARLVLVNRGTDALPAFATPLDADNGYRVLAMGDPDGDGRDELAVMRNNRIRYFYQVESGNTSLFTDFDGISTNSRSLQMANLDGTGYTAGTRLNSSPTSLSMSVRAGILDKSILSIQMSSIGSDTNLPITVAKENGSSWFSFSVGQGGTTPVNIFVSDFDATSLKPGTYRDRLKVTSTSGNVLNQPYYIPVELVVTEASFSLNPTFFSVVTTKAQPMTATQDVIVGGLPGLSFTAAILSLPELTAATSALGAEPTRAHFTESGALVLGSGEQEYTTSLTRASQSGRAAAANDWPSGVAGVSAFSAGTVVTSTITVAVSSTLMSADAATGVLLVLADERAGSFPDNLKSSEFVAIRTDTPVFLPLIAR